jgi:hypothetical protein
VGAFMWHTNRQEELAQQAEEQRAETAAMHRARRAECIRFINGQRSPNWEFYDLSTARGMPRATCDDEGLLRCPVGYVQDQDALKRHGCTVCAEGFRGQGCQDASCEVRLQMHGGRGTCESNGEMVCDDGYYGRHCEQMCTGFKEVRGAGCHCPDNYFFKDREACDGECAHETIGGLTCSECIPNRRGTGLRGGPGNASTGCPVTVVSGSLLITDEYDEDYEFEACEFARPRGHSRSCVTPSRSGLERFREGGFHGLSADPDFRVRAYANASCSGQPSAQTSRGDDIVPNGDEGWKSFQIEPNDGQC